MIHVDFHNIDKVEAAERDGHTWVTITDGDGNSVALYLRPSDMTAVGKRLIKQAAKLIEGRTQHGKNEGV